ncbi:MAG: JAB domain-containing protein [Clostridia bacterium]|nr:JAB domain-containing protein [Clostridia bacterium]
MDADAEVSGLFRLYGSYNAIIEANIEDLRDLAEISDFSADLAGMLSRIARYIYREKARRVARISDYRAAGEYFKMLYLGERNEIMYLLSLGLQGEIINTEIVQEGTVDETNFHVRRILERALQMEAAAIVLSHNHPGGTARISYGDYQCTSILSHAAYDNEIVLIDHIVIADGKAHSMARWGEMPEQREPGGMLGGLWRNWCDRDEL